MCLIAWNWQPGSANPLLLVANRDEFYARPTAALHHWTDAPILAGRDLQAGGTWLGVSHSGRMAALTNYRHPAVQRSDAPSRGALVSAFLTSELSAPDYLHDLAGRAAAFNPFNLLVFDGASLLGLQSRDAQVIHFSAGVGAVSNADFQTAWPKLHRLKNGLHHLHDQGPGSDAELLALLQDRRLALDSELPDTGIALELERLLSAVFITSPHYGTRACSVLRYQPGQISFLEHSFDVQGAVGRQCLKILQNK